MPPAGIDGVAVSRETGQPIAGVHVSFRPSQGRPYGAISDGAGHFSITGIAPGVYSVEAGRAGFVYLPPKGQGRVRSSVNLGAGERLTDLKIEMAQRYVVAGRVVDENGDPLQSVLVHAETASPDEPLRPPPPQESPLPIFTDDHGEFHLSLAPGQYYIAASPLGGLDNEAEIRTDGTSGAPYERTYYPNAPEKAAAAPVSVPVPNDTGTLTICLGRQFTRPLTVTTPADPRAASLGGVVNNEITGAPLARVHVSLWDFETRRRYGAMTRTDGRFSVTGMPEGTYGVLTTRVGFATPRRSSGPVKLRAGEQKQDLKLLMTPAGAITGRVLDGDGEPMEFASVYAENGSGSYGVPTDGLGHFRIGGLLPGHYRIEASTGTPRGAPPEIRTDGTVETHFGANHLPSAVEVRAGNDAGSIEIRLLRTRFMRVSGRVTGVPQGARISLAVQHGGGGFSDLPDTDGSFEWWFEPGKYVISAHEGSGPVFDGEHRLASAPVMIAVGDADVDNLELQLLPPSEIQGRVEYEAGGAQPPAAERWLRLPPIDQMGGGASLLSADGSFTLANLPSGRYRVLCDWVPPVYVKSMRLGSTEIQGDILDLSRGSGGAALTVLVSSRFGRISGTVQGDHAAATDLKVALVDIAPGYVRPPQFAEIGAGGRYSFDSVAPGDYKLAVVGENDLVIRGAGSLAEYDPVVETFDAATVRASENTISDLKIPKQR